MKRFFRAAAGCLSLILAFGPLSAQAQVARAVVLTAAPVPVVVAPLSASAAPLSVAALPALGASVAAPAALALAAPAAAVPASAQASAPPAAARAASVPPRTAEVVRAFAAPTTVARPQDGFLFDGALRAAAADDAAPVRAPAAGPASAPRLPRASSAGRVLRFAALGTAVAAAAPVLWSAAPTDGQLILFGLASLPLWGHVQRT